MTDGTPQPPEAGKSSRSVAGAAILVVDDDQLVRLVMTTMLTRIGARPSAVNDGRAAIAELDRPGASFDAVLLDLMMPGMDGVETLREIKKRDARLPVVICSACGVDMRALDAEFGPQIVLEKPFVVASLQKALESALR